MSKHPLFRSEEPEESRARQEAEYEEKLVGHLLNRYGLSSYKSWLRKQCSYAGFSGLVLPLFLNSFGEYPVHMAVAKIPGLSKTCSLDKLYNNFPTRKMVTRYIELRQETFGEELSDKPFALLFPWPYVAKGMVLHDKHVNLDYLLPGLKKPCVRTIWTLPKRRGKYGNYLVLEPIDQFLADIAWEPEPPNGK